MGMSLHHLGALGAVSAIVLNILHRLMRLRPAALIGLLRQTRVVSGLGLMMLGLAVACPLQAAETVLRLNGNAALQAAVAEGGVDGAVLELAPGDYEAVAFKPGRMPVAVRSVDADNPARLRGLSAARFNGLLLEALVFDYRFQPGDTKRTKPFDFLKCQGLTVRDSRFVGDQAYGMGPVDDGYGVAFGLHVRGCDDVSVENNKVSGFYRGVIFSQIDRLVVRGNELTDMRSDGMNFAQVRDVIIEDNHFHSFRRSPGAPDHPDMIQFWTNRTEHRSENIVIRGNVLNSGAGPWTQSIFMRNEVVDAQGGGPDMFYRNILIEENLILNAHLHGVTVGETDGLVIRRNTMIQNRGSASEDWRRMLWMPQINVKPASRRVEITGNITHGISGYDSQPDWRVEDILLIKNDGRASKRRGFHYSRVFQDGGEAGSPGDLSNWRLLPGGPGDKPGLGASLLK